MKFYTLEPVAQSILYKVVNQGFIKSSITHKIKWSVAEKNVRSFCTAKLYIFLQKLLNFFLAKHGNVFPYIMF